MLAERHVDASGGIKEPRRVPPPSPPHSEFETRCAPKPPPVPDELDDETVDDDDLEDRPPRAKKRATHDEARPRSILKPTPFPIVVVADSKKILRGKLKAEVYEDALLLRAKDEEDDVDIPVGADV